MSARASLRAAAAGALRLRAWALALLAGGPPSPPPAACADAWQAFLKVDRVALPLRDLLVAADAFEVVPEPERGWLDRRAVAESLHALAVRAEAGHLSALLAARGWDGLVLKGGACVLGGGGDVDVRDLDLLLTLDQAREIAAVLDAGGYTRADSELPPGSAGAHELAGRMSPSGMVVELHFALPAGDGLPDPWSATVPLPLPALRRLANADHLWHVVVHALLHHPERRGALRDVLVGARAMAWCSADEIRRVEHRVRAHPAAPLLARMLEMVRALAAGGGVADTFAREAATSYLLYGFKRRYDPPEGLLLATARTATSLAGTRGEYARVWAGAPGSVLARGYRGPHWIDRRAAPVALALRAAWRAGNTVAATVPGAWIARTARSLAAER